LGKRGTPADRPLVWGLLTCLIAAVTALMGYSIGGATGDGATTRASAPARPTAAPALLQLSDVYAQGRAYGYRLAEDRAFVRGRKQGLAEGSRAAARKRARERLPFPGRGWYAVGVGADGKTPATPPTPLTRGRSYTLCKGGAALCEAATRAPGR
jgi:hypothetical protein